MTAIALPRAARGAWRRPDVSWLALRVWQRNRDVYLNTWKAEAIWPLVEPLLTLIALGVGLGDFVDLGGEGGRGEGMQLMDGELMRLHKEGVISAEDAYLKAANKKDFEALSGEQAQAPGAVAAAPRG